MSVAILGCGPAGLLAAHACHIYGARATIFSEKSPSRIGGAQFLHREIPGLTWEDQDGEVDFIKLGGHETYAQRVYGVADAKTSWGDYPIGKVSVWEMQRAYQTLWDRHVDSIIDAEIASYNIPQLLAAYDLVLSSIPLNHLCVGGHSFTDQQVWIQMGIAHCPEMSILYNGTEQEETEHQWYRTSDIFSHRSTEWAFPPQPEIMRKEVIKISKPLSTDCNCHPGLRRIGRYGQWKKGVLVHHAFEEASEALSEM